MSPHSRSLTGSGNFISADLPGNMRRFVGLWDERRHKNSVAACVVRPREHRMKTGTQGELTHPGAESPCVGGRMRWSQRASLSCGRRVVHHSNRKEVGSRAQGEGRWYNSIFVFPHPSP